MLRADGAGGRVVVLAFPYDAALVSAVRTLPGRRFDWDAREWVAPADDWVSVKLRKILHLSPQLTRSPEVDAWLTAASERWIGHVRTSVYDGRGWWALDTLAGSPHPCCARASSSMTAVRWCR